ncbi:hypothetical protein DIPPA_15315 [Diplonema papillatum]|nr:hypothetical protein DIPPA_15315 [Diplonema papillatum]
MQQGCGSWVDGCDEDDLIALSAHVTWLYDVVLRELSPETSADRRFLDEMCKVCQVLETGRDPPAALFRKNPPLAELLADGTLYAHAAKVVFSDLPGGLARVLDGPATPAAKHSELLAWLGEDFGFALAAGAAAELSARGRAFRPRAHNRVVGFLLREYSTSFIEPAEIAAHVQSFAGGAAAAPTGLEGSLLAWLRAVAFLCGNPAAPFNPPAAASFHAAVADGRLLALTFYKYDSGFFPLSCLCLGEDLTEREMVSNWDVILCVCRRSRVVPPFTPEQVVRLGQSALRCHVLWLVQMCYVVLKKSCDGVLGACLRSHAKEDTLASTPARRLATSHSHNTFLDTPAKQLMFSPFLGGAANNPSPTVSPVHPYRYTSNLSTPEPAQRSHQEFAVTRGTPPTTGNGYSADPMKPPVVHSVQYQEVTLTRSTPATSLGIDLSSDPSKPPVVHSIHPAGPAALCGVEAGMLVVKVDGALVPTCFDFARNLLGKTTATLVVSSGPPRDDPRGGHPHACPAAEEPSVLCSEASVSVVGESIRRWSCARRRAGADPALPPAAEAGGAASPGPGCGSRLAVPPMSASPGPRLPPSSGDEHSSSTCGGPLPASSLSGRHAQGSFSPEPKSTVSPTRDSCNESSGNALPAFSLSGRRAEGSSSPVPRLTVSPARNSGGKSFGGALPAFSLSGCLQSVESQAPLPATPPTRTSCGKYCGDALPAFTLSGCQHGGKPTESRPVSHPDSAAVSVTHADATGLGVQDGLPVVSHGCRGTRISTECDETASCDPSKVPLASSCPGSGPPRNTSDPGGATPLERALLLVVSRGGAEQPPLDASVNYLCLDGIAIAESDEVPVPESDELAGAAEASAFRSPAPNPAPAGPRCTRGGYTGKHRGDKPSGREQPSRSPGPLAAASRAPEPAAAKAGCRPSAAADPEVLWADDAAAPEPRPAGGRRTRHAAFIAAGAGGRQAAAATPPQPAGRAGREAGEKSAPPSEPGSPDSSAGAASCKRSSSAGRLRCSVVDGLRARVRCSTVPSDANLSPSPGRAHAASPDVSSVLGAALQTPHGTPLGSRGRRLLLKRGLPAKSVSTPVCDLTESPIVACCLSGLDEWLDRSLAGLAASKAALSGFQSGCGADAGCGTPELWLNGARDSLPADPAAPAGSAGLASDRSPPAVGTGCAASVPALLLPPHRVGDAEGTPSGDGLASGGSDRKGGDGRLALGESAAAPGSRSRELHRLRVIDEMLELEGEVGRLVGRLSPAGPSCRRLSPSCTLGSGTPEPNNPTQLPRAHAGSPPPPAFPDLPAVDLEPSQWEPGLPSSCRLSLPREQPPAAEESPGGEAGSLLAAARRSAKQARRSAGCLSSVPREESSFEVRAEEWQGRTPFGNGSSSSPASSVRLSINQGRQTARVPGARPLSPSCEQHLAVSRAAEDRAAAEQARDELRRARKLRRRGALEKLNANIAPPPPDPADAAAAAAAACASPSFPARSPYAATPLPERRAAAAPGFPAKHNNSISNSNSSSSKNNAGNSNSNNNSSSNKLPLLLGLAEAGPSEGKAGEAKKTSLRPSRHEQQQPQQRERGARGNKLQTVNAVKHVCLPGRINELARQLVLDAIQACNATHFLLHLKAPQQPLIKSVYAYASDDAPPELRKIFGVGPRNISPDSFDCLRYDCGSKRFTLLPPSFDLLDSRVDAVSSRKPMVQAP